ncbi:reverse transcriptase [Cucumis melo var. makuwa]|uniref:Reverse transcriptase n=1 Tax=Cucumis melo var. makuwa TaxID=1194695 RepID=A0A5A7V843_CUCMM|nr:reverse transcriptase [Cucumis melo var. makuwa]
MREIRRNEIRFHRENARAEWIKDQHVLGALSGHRRPDFRSYGSACSTCSGTCQRLGEGKGRGKLASDREGSVTCHMRTQFCFRVYVSVHSVGWKPRGQAAFDGRKQTTIERPSLGVVDANKPLKVKAEQFNCMLEEYLYHFVDGRQRNWVQMLNVVQFDHDAQTDLLIRRSQFEIDDSRHVVFPPVIDGPYVGNNPQVHRVEKEWEQMADIARVYLEEASRPMEERVDQKQCPTKFEWMTWNTKKIEKSRRSLLTE